MSELQNQITEAKKREEFLEESIKEKQQICEQLEANLVHLRDGLNSKVVHEKFENSSIDLNDILKSQRNPCIKTCLGCVQKGNNDFSEKINNHPKAYVKSLFKQSMKKEERTSIEQLSKKPFLPFKKEAKSSNEQVSKASFTPPKKFSQIRYPYIFQGYFFAYSNFGQKAIMCREYGTNPYKNNGFKFRNNQTKIKGVGRNYHNFSPLQNLNMECLKCRNYGHKASNCRLMEISEKPKFIREQKKLWKEKTSEEECLISFKAQDKEDPWYVDSGCSKHVTGNKDKFLSLKKQKGKVTFGDDASGNIIGKGTVNLGKDKAKNVLLVENLNLAF